VIQLSWKKLLTFSLIAASGVSVSGCGNGGSAKSGSGDTDNVDPVIAISGPSSNGTFASYADNVILSGTATDNVGVTRVTWSLNGGAASDVTGLAMWTTPVIQLDEGDNIVTVTATDAAGNQASALLTVTFTPGPGSVFVVPSMPQ
jgi:hypothetical protein